MNNPGKNGFSRLFLVFLIISLISAHAPADENSALLIAFYASGGTLEQEMGLITDDFAQVVRGAENLSERVTILATYGGANKPGWNGMTIATLDELRKDLADGELGNSNVSVQKIQNANMGDPESLSFFLSYIERKYSYDRLFLIFIGHGQAYTGMLFDQNHGDDGLSIEELTKAVGSRDICLIGFDSCMMGCLEVLSALSPSASYIIASEETEPEEGWPYEPWIRYIGAHPGRSTEEYARVLFDEYMKNPSPGKTIAFLNPKEAGYLTKQLDQFARDLHALTGDPGGCEIINRILSKTQHFGLFGSGEPEKATMDIYSLAYEAGLSVPYLSGTAEELLEGVNRTVIFAKHDAIVPDAHGIAILSPVMISPVFYEYYRESAFITPSWDRFLTRYMKECYQESGNLTPSSG